MNKYLPVASILGVMCAITIQHQSILASERSEISEIIKEFTVQIDGEASGTGTIIEQDGDTYTVITCWHVVQFLKNYQVITSDGEIHQASEIQNLPAIDLATMKFTSQKTYPVAQLADSQNILEGTNTYVASYPDPIPGVPERYYFLFNSNIVSRLRKADKGYQIIHDHSSTMGGSGGGIFDLDGRLIGINGRFISDGNTGKSYGVGIPLEIYLAFRTDLKISEDIALNQDIVSLGIQKYKKQDYQGAISEFNKAIEMKTNDIEALYNRGASFFALKDYDAAIADFSRLLQLSPINPIAYFYRGYIRASKKDYQSAIVDYTQAIKSYPNFDSAYTNRGFAYAKSGNVQNALDDYNQAIKINSNSAIAYYNRGLLYSRNLEKYDKALDDFNQSIKLTPEDAQFYVDRGNVYSLLNEIQLAIDNYSQAINIDSQHAKAFYNRGLLYSQKYQPERALEDLQRAATLFESQGDNTGYKASLDRIKEIMPN